MAQWEAATPAPTGSSVRGLLAASLDDDRVASGSDRPSPRRQAVQSPSTLPLPLRDVPHFVQRRSSLIPRRARW